MRSILRAGRALSLLCLLSGSCFVASSVLAQIPKLDAALNLFVQQPDVEMKLFA